jgi:hypothetical protein
MTFWSAARSESSEPNLGWNTHWLSQSKPRFADQIMFDSRLRQYDDLFSTLALAPLGERRLLDTGCANGKWLEICCR